MKLFAKRTIDWLLVGLGNPGSEYVQTRHNVGYLAIDFLAESLAARYWKSEAGARTAQVKDSDTGQSLLLVKPETFMNKSGSAVAQLARRLKLDCAHIIVIADELDLPPGEIRIKTGGGDSGHRGHRSIIEKLGREYIRVRVGIGRPPGQMDPADYVLQPLRPRAFEDLSADAARAAHSALAIVRQEA
jgi:PTH1 family peptidyl-tRNA hydrolase